MSEMFDDAIERLLASHATHDAAAPGPLWQVVHDSGFALAAAPLAAGGAQVPWADLYGVLAACGRHAAAVPLPEAMLANWLLGRCGLGPANGLASFAAESTLLQRGDRFSGRLTAVPWGQQVAQVVAISADARPSVVLLDATHARATEPVFNLAGEPRCDLELNEAVPVASAHLSAGSPAELPRDTLLQGGALLRAAQTAGALQAVLALCTQHAQQRVQFGKAIGNYQAIQHQLAVLAEHAGLAAVAAQAACAAFTDAPSLLHVASAKVCAAEAAGTAAAIAHAVHGAIGFTHEHALHRYTQRLWAWRSEYGSLTHWSQRLGRAACAQGGAALWPAITAGQFVNPATG